MRIRKKLTLGYLLVAALVAVVGFLGLQAVRAISLPFDDVSRNSVPMVQVVDGLKFAGTRIVSATSEWALMESERAATAAAKNVKAQLYGAEAEEESEIQSGQLLYETLLKQYEALLKDEATPEAERLFERVRSSGEELQLIANQMVELKKASVSGRMILAKKEELEIAERNFLEAADSAIELENAEVKSDIASVDNKITAAIRIVAACVVLTLVVALVIGVFSARSIAEPLIRMKHASAQIGKGNLDSRLEVDSRDELGDLADSFNRMADDLKQSYIERKKQEHDLIFANTLLNTQQETSLDGILVVGENQEMISFNSRFVEMWQIPDAILETRSDKLALQSVLDTLESPEEFLNGVKYLYAHKEIKLRDELKLKDGRTFDRYSAPMFGADDNYYGRVFYFRDVTERKRAEQALRESESRYKTLFDGATDSIMILDTERGKAGNIVAANQAAAKTTGYTSEELLKLNIAGLRTPLQASLVEDDFERVANGERLTFEILRRRKDGTTFPIEINASVLSIEGKRYILDFARDLTQRKQTETEVTMLAKAIRSIHEGVVVTDPGGTIIFVNDASVGMFGYERDEIVGKHVTTLVWANDAEFVHEVIARSKIEGWEGEALSRRKDGTIFPAYVSASDIHDENGNSVAIIGVCQDITERRRSMEELQNAKEEAEAASRAKSEFLANMSHEIRTPMNGIVGMTELALDTDLTAEQREYLKLVKLSADSLLRVINDILDFSKIEAGKLELELAEFSLQDTVDTVMKAMGVRADQKGLELAYYIRQGVPELIVGDEGRLRQILVNLVGNAIKFTDTGEVVMRVDVDAGDDEQVVLHFCVRDTGIGVPIEKQALIFDSFTQADGSTTRKYGGTGLGLAISAQLVRAMNGEIWIDSPALVGPPDEQINEANPGSMFHFTACFGVAQTSTALRTLLDLSTVIALPVLVVDDNATNRRILEVQLKNWNMKPVIAASASEAVNAIREARQARQPFELVLMDLHMPEVDGVELTAIIRQMPEAAGVKIIMMSSAVRENYSNQDFGVDAYLLKPVKASDLLGVIRSVLGKTAATQDGSKPLRSITSTHPARVLVAEDSPVNQELIKRLLAKWGHSAVIACNGKQALSFLEAENFDVVLMDVQMPEMNGFEATALIRERDLATGGHTPIIALTAHALKGDRERCTAAGMDDYLSKPIEAQALFEVIDRVTTSEVSVNRNDQPRKPAFDASWLLANFEDDFDLIRRLADVFVEASIGQLNQISEAIVIGNFQTVELVAHSLKGAVANFRAPAAVEAAARLESIGRGGDLSNAEASFEVLKREVESLNKDLATLREVTVQ